MEKLKVASLFCGCGGTDVGLMGDFHFLENYYAPNPIEIIYANDIDVNACSLFEHNFDLKTDNRDINLVDAQELPDFDILTGGFPCQSFSIVAQNPKRLGFKDAKGKLFFEMCRILREKQPKAFIAENVKGILSANNKTAFPLIIEEFEASGYTVFFALLNSVNFGIPQKRERVIIVGFRKDLNILDYQFPAGTTLTANDTIPLKFVLEEVISEKYYFSEKAVAGMLKSKVNMNKGRVQDINNPSNTVTAHLCKVSLNSTDPVLFEHGKYRRFTPREVARIQSFPDTYNLIGSELAQYKALGNAIPPVLMWHITQSIIFSLKQRSEIKSLKEKQPIQRKNVFN